MSDNIVYKENCVFTSHLINILSMPFSTKCIYQKIEVGLVICNMYPVKFCQL